MQDQRIKKAKKCLIKRHWLITPIKSKIESIHILDTGPALQRLGKWQVLSLRKLRANF